MASNPIPFCCFCQERRPLFFLALPDRWRFLISAIRNTLFHGYMDVDRAIVYEVLQNGLGDIEELKRVFARHL